MRLLLALSTLLVALLFGVPAMAADCGGDLASGPQPGGCTVIAVQGKAIARNPPANGQALIWSSALNAYVPTTTSGTLSVPVTVANGGTGLGTLTQGALLVGNNTNSPTFLAPVNGDCVVGSGGVWIAAACPGGGGGGIPGGSNTNVQFNNASSFGGSSGINLSATKVLSMSIGLGADQTGDIYYNGGSGNLTRLAIGSNGKVLTASGGVPSWVAPTTVASAYTVIAPTGVAATDQTTFETALAAGKPILMEAGVWSICKQELIPVKTTITGIVSSGNPGSAAPSMSRFQTIVQCPMGQGTWSSGQAFFALQDSDVISGIAVFGNGDGGTGSDSTQPQVSCFSAHNALYPKIDQSAAVRCQGYGIDNFSNGSVPGPSIYYSQGIILSNTLVYGNNLGGYFADQSNGGFVSDQMIGPNNDFVVNGFGNVDYQGVQIYMNNSFITGAIFQNRIEDGEGHGIVLKKISFVQVLNNNIDKESILLTGGASNVVLSGNRISCCDFGFTAPGVTFAAGSYDTISSAGNFISGSGGNGAYQVNSDATISNSHFYDQTSGGYGDATSEAKIAPFVGGTNLDRQTYTPVALSGSTFTPVNFNGGKNFLFFVPHTCAPCMVDNPSTNPLPVGQHGFMAFIQDPTGGGTISLGPFYSGWTAPPLSTVPNAIDLVEYTVGPLGISLMAPAANQLTAATNVLTGGAGMTSGWSAHNSTFANAVGGCTDPVGGSACSTITEDTTFNGHSVGQTASLSGVGVASAWVNAGTPPTSAVLTATFSSSGNLMTVTSVTSGTVFQHGQRISCGGCGVEGAYVVGFVSGSGGTGTYNLNYSATITTPTSVTLTEPRFAWLTAFDSSFLNVVGVGIDPRSGQIVDRAGNSIAISTGYVAGTGVYYGSFSYQLPGTNWWRLILIYGGFTTADASIGLGLLGQGGGSPGTDWTDYTGHGGGFVQLWGPQLYAAGGGTGVTKVTNLDVTGTCTGCGTANITAGTGITVTGTNPYTITATGATATSGTVRIAQLTATSGVTTELDFTGANWSSAYNSVTLRCHGIKPSGAAADTMVAEVQTGGSAWQNTNYQASSFFSASSGTSGPGASGSTNAEIFGGEFSGMTNTTLNNDTRITIALPADTTAPKSIQWEADLRSATSSNLSVEYGSSSWIGGNNALTGLRLRNATGTDTFGGICTLSGES
jgi:hypothetical protein